MLTVAQIERFYTYFYQRKYTDYKYKFRATKTTESVCNSFLQIIDKKYSLHCVGESFLWEYFLFQFQYWEDCALENKYTDKILLAWIVGKKAFERWDTRDREHDWMLESCSILKVYNLDKNDIFSKSESLEKPKESKPYDSSKAIRRLYLNTDMGLVMCIEATTLFDPKDTSCIQCKFRAECKELLKVNYPKIYKKRGL